VAIREYRAEALAGFANTGPKHWQVVVRSTYPTTLGNWRTDSTETQISCLF